MRDTDNPDRLQRLGSGKLMRLRDAAGTCIHCLSGRLWITQEDDPEDVILLAGQACTIRRSGLTLIEALSPARLLVRAMEQADPVAGNQVQGTAGGPVSQRVPQARVGTSTAPTVAEMQTTE